MQPPIRRAGHRCLPWGHPLPDGGGSGGTARVSFTTHTIMSILIPFGWRPRKRGSAVATRAGTERAGTKTAHREVGRYTDGREKDRPLHFVEHLEVAVVPPVADFAVFDRAR